MTEKSRAKVRCFFAKKGVYYTTNETGTPRACEVCEEFTHFGPEVGH
jgi:hypothetical protein